MQVIEMPIDLLQEISSIRVHVPQDLRSSDARRQVAKTVQVVHERFEKGIPVLDPADDLRITDESYHKIARKVESLEARVHAHKLHKDVEKRDRLYPMYKRKIAIVQEIAVLTKSAKAAGGLTFRAQLKGMKRVLRRLGHVTADDAVQLKGRAACEISSGDELVLTEMIFDGAFNDLPADVCAAVLSCFVFDEKAADDAAPPPPEELMRPLEPPPDKARRVATVQAESKLEVDVTEFVAKFKTGLMALTLRWCRGAKFSELVAAKDGTKEKGKTDLYEGSIIRCIRRLEELVSELSSVCKVVGNVQLSDKFAAASTLMKRDIIFAASLYLEA
ncbi:Skiv2l2 protein [Baffinella frigidus]|nr:Skiv2l2 protein [Cryptophyta sp. CCMP2293]